MAVRAALARPAAGDQATLERLDPDVVALQEVWSGDETSQADEFAEALGMHAVFAAPSYSGPRRPAHRRGHEGIDLASRC